MIARENEDGREGWVGGLRCLGTARYRALTRCRSATCAAGYGYLIVATATQCHVYNTTNLGTPHIFDLKDTVTLLLQVCDCGVQEGGGVCPRPTK